MRTYFERNLVINNKELKHSGIFNPEEVFSAINKALKARGYEKREKKTEESVSSEERSNYICQLIESSKPPVFGVPGIEFGPNFSDYIRLTFSVCDIHKIDKAIEVLSNKLSRI